MTVILSSLDEVKKVIEDHQSETTTSFAVAKQTKNFGTWDIKGKINLRALVSFIAIHIGEASQNALSNTEL